MYLVYKIQVFLLLSFPLVMSAAWCSILLIGIGYYLSKRMQYLRGKLFEND